MKSTGRILRKLELAKGNGESLGLNKKQNGETHTTFTLVAHAS